METSNRDRLLDWLWFLAWALVSSIWCLSAAGQLSATWDEPVYVARGLEHWRTGSYQKLMKLGTMPLPVDVETLPLYVWERLGGAPFDSAEDLDRLLPLARACTLLFWWTLLFYARLGGRLLAGPWAGRLAVALIACEPSFLAHATLATTDISIAACLLALVYHYRSGRESGWIWRVAVPSFWFGAAVLAKASGLVFGPLCLLAVELEQYFRTRSPSEAGIVPAPSTARKLRALVADLWKSLAWRDLIQIGFAGVLLTFLYVGSDWKPQPSFVAWSQGLPEGTYRTSMVWLAEHLCVFSNAGDGLIRQVAHNVRGHGSYLLGQSDPRALWYYFPLVLTIKVSVPLLLLPLILAVVRPKCLLNWATASAAFLLAFSLVCRVQIGIRFMLPLLALAAVGLSAATVQTIRDLAPGWRKRVVLAGTSAGLAWTTASSLIVWPNALCYVNELWGGTREGYHLVSEANYDWGQGLKELASWQKRNGVEDLDVWYFGTDPTLQKLPMHEMHFHALPIQSPDDMLEWVQGRRLAVSTTILYGPLSITPTIRNAVTFLRSRQHVGRTTTFLIFDFTAEGKSKPEEAPAARITCPSGSPVARAR